MNSTALEYWLAAVVEAHRTGEPVSDAIVNGAFDVQRSLHSAWRKIGDQRAERAYGQWTGSEHYEGWALGTCPCDACRLHKEKVSRPQRLRVEDER